MAAGSRQLKTLKHRAPVSLHNLRHAELLPAACCLPPVLLFYFATACSKGVQTLSFVAEQLLSDADLHTSTE